MNEAHNPDPVKTIAKNNLSPNHLRFLDRFILFFLLLGRLFCHGKHDATKQQKKQQVFQVQLKAGAASATHKNIYKKISKKLNKQKS